MRRLPDGGVRGAQALQQLIEWNLNIATRRRAAGWPRLRQGRRTTNLLAKLVRLAFSLAFFGPRWSCRMVAPRLGAPRGDTPARRGSVAHLIARDQVPGRALSNVPGPSTANTRLRSAPGRGTASLEHASGILEEPYYTAGPAGFVLLPPLD